MKHFILVAFCTLIILAVANIAFGAAGYYITDLGSIYQDTSWAYDINNAGQVVGHCGASRAFLWEDDNMEYLESFSNEYWDSRATAINEAGHVVGEAKFASYIYHAASWDPIWGIHDLGTLGGNSKATDINESFQVVGYCQGGNFIYEDGVMQDLGVDSYPRAMNNLGQIIGQRYLWDNGDITILEFNAWDINDAGQVLGYDRIWEDGVSEYLPVLPGYSSREGLGINEFGVVVGQASNGPFIANLRAVVWEDGVMYDLNDLLLDGGGWQLREARAINDHGQIVGNGINPDGYERAFLLTPIPEPSTLTLLGLAFLVGIRRFRKR